MTTKGDIRLIKRHARLCGKPWRPSLAGFEALPNQLRAALRAQMKRELALGRACPPIGDLVADILAMKDA